MEGEKYYVDIPYDKKDVAKSLGGKWDRENSCWYVTKKDHSLCSQFKTLSYEQVYQRNVKVYLDIPYEFKDQAKAEKARWDPVMKSWYVMGLDHPLMGKFPIKEH